LSAVGPRSPGGQAQRFCVAAVPPQAHSCPTTTRSRPRHRVVVDPRSATATPLWARVGLRAHHRPPPTDRHGCSRIQSRYDLIRAPNDSTVSGSMIAGPRVFLGEERHGDGVCLRFVGQTEHWRQHRRSECYGTRYHNGKMTVGFGRYREKKCGDGAMRILVASARGANGPSNLHLVGSVVILMIVQIQ
jgi:hypothetical protein